jgi:hypothetical protein
MYLILRQDSCLFKKLEFLNGFTAFLVKLHNQCYEKFNFFLNSIRHELTSYHGRLFNLNGFFFCSFELVVCLPVFLFPTNIRRVPLVEQELPTLPEHQSSPLVFDVICVTRSLVLYVCFVDRCLSFCTFSFSRCVVCSSLIYGFWLPLWYLQTLLISTSSLSDYKCVIHKNNYLMNNLSDVLSNKKEV